MYKSKQQIAANTAMNKALLKGPDPVLRKLFKTQTDKLKEAQSFWKREAKETLQQLRMAKKASDNCIKDLKSQVRQLQDELDEAKADALDELNDRAEIVRELRKRAVPEGWKAVILSKGSGPQLRQVLKVSTLRITGGSQTAWRWRTATDGGDCVTLAEAVKAAEAVKLPKVKKAKRK